MTEMEVMSRIGGCEARSCGEELLFCFLGGCLGGRRRVKSRSQETGGDASPGGGSAEAQQLYQTKSLHKESGLHWYPPDSTLNTFNFPRHLLCTMQT